METLFIERGFAVHPEFLLYLSLEGPHFLWVRNIDMFVCHFTDRRPGADIQSSFSWGGKDSGVDLHENDDGQIIGFNVLHLTSAKGMLPKLFQMIKEENITLQAFVPAVNELCLKVNETFGFHNCLDEFLKDDIVRNLVLSVIDLEDIQTDFGVVPKIVPLTRERFLLEGGRLLT